MNLNIRLLRPHDLSEWQRMRLALWPYLTEEEVRREMEEILADSLQPVFVAERPEDGLAAFVEVSLHHEYTPGCTHYPVGYIEGWYVDHDVRQQGLGRRLFEAAEDWARSQGCREMASDCDLDNEISWKAHLALGYKEENRLIHFFKAL